MKPGRNVALGQLSHQLSITGGGIVGAVVAGAGRGFWPAFEGLLAGGALAADNTGQPRS
jgi:hypothetical protein